MIEISITFKDSERSLTKRFMEYNTMFFDRESEKLKELVDEVSQEFKGDVETDAPDIVIKGKMIWQ